MSTVTRAGVRDTTGGRLRARRRIWVYCAVGLVVIAGSAAISSLPLLRVHSEVGSVAREDVALRDAGDLRTALSDFQVFSEPRMSKLSPASALDISHAVLLATSVTPKTVAVLRALPTIGLGNVARDLDAASAAFKKAITGLSVTTSGRPGPTVTAAVTAERAAFAQMWAVTSTVATQLRAARDLNLQQANSFLSRGHVVVLAADALAAVAVLFGAFVFGQRGRRREQRERTDAHRQAFDTSLQRGLDMSKSEPDVYRIVNRAMHESVPHLQVEMLVADSSRAHFHQTLSTTSGEPDERSGCGVVSPLDCPATTRTHKLVFPSSGAIDACPYLQDRASGACSAACVAISIAGKTVGVMHATGPDNVPPTDLDIGYFESTSHRASDRIGMLRAFEKSETQARSDPLTGLWNRRSVENRVHDLQREGTAYALAYGDLDHFKILNDTHGHEAGDQALRMFSRVLRDAIRPNDIAARYGGEEFVIVLPDCTPDAATAVLERVRERLALALTTGRVPAFTVSFGLAASIDADTFDEVVAIADQALLAAKAAGRNRVVVAVDSTDHAESAPVA